MSRGVYRLLCFALAGSVLSISMMGCPSDASEVETPVIPTEEEEAAKAAESITEENADAELARLKKEIEEGH